MDALPNFMFTHFKILLFVMKLLFPLEVIVIIWRVQHQWCQYFAYFKL